MKGTDLEAVKEDEDEESESIDESRSFSTS